MFDPKAKWQTLKSEHFRINYPKKLELLAQKSAKILEEVYPGITTKWNWRPWGKTEVILVDNTDKANGMAAVLPYNWMVIFATPPSPDSSLAHYDDWLRMLLIHEFTHIVQIDAYGGAWIPLRFLLGKTVSPSGINPTWIREGIAQYDETVFTGGGRGRGSYSEMIVRTAILEDTFPSIDFADGLSWKWPGYKAAYAYGITFVHWLIDTYGEKKFMEFDKKVRSSILIAMINHQARNVYGKTFYELWREWQQHLIDKYKGSCATLRGEGLTPYSVVLKNVRDDQYYAPSLSPSGTSLVYSVLSPHRSPQVRLMNLQTGDVDVIKKHTGSSQFSWSSDGTKIAYAKIGKYKKYYWYSDLWVYDFNVKKKRKRFKKLTTGARAKDPSFFPGGGSLVYVSRDRGTEILQRYDFATKKSVVLTANVPQYIQFANPRVSHDGKYIAVSVWSPGDGWRVYRYNSDGSNPKRLTKGEGLVIEARPIWTPDGKHIIYSSDETGISNLYRVKSSGGKKEMITNTLTGIYEPSMVRSSEIMAMRYNSNGYEIVKFNSLMPVKIQKGHAKKHKKTFVGESPKFDYSFSKGDNLSGIGLEGVPTGKGYSSDNYDPFTNKKPFKTGKYVALGKSLFLPRFIIPSVAYADDALFAMLMTGGMDILRWHSWVASVNYRTDAKHVGYSFNYTYSRWGPHLGFGIRDYAVDFGEVLFGATNRQVHLYEHRRGAYGYIALPVDNHSFSLGYFYEDHMSDTALQPAETASLNLGKFAGVRGTYTYSDAEVYPASISPENGRKIKLHTTVTNSIFGSGDRNEQTIFAGDWREYIRIFRHHIFALRASGGMTWGDNLVQGTFGMGGAIGEGTLASGGSFTYFPFRGLPVSTLSRSRAMLFSGEYRFPIIEPLKGLGTAPFFIKSVSGAILADYGNAWNAHEGGCDKFSTFFDDFLLSVGAEIRGDFYLGHGLPLHGRIGYAIVILNRDRLAGLTDPMLKTNLKYGMFILALGTSF
ncbi:MAG: hypothetical protein HN337_09240 [Deltaproteobacteria bacterium]|nr:hypothetical protein [Deltaproteobacteria bacterium]